MGDDTFTIKLKGIDRLLFILKKFPNIDKHIIGMCSKVDRYYKLFSGIPRVTASLSIEKKKIPSLFWPMDHTIRRMYWHQLLF